MASARRPRPPTPSQALRNAVRDATRRWLAISMADFAFTVGFGVLGAIMGGGLWYAAATFFHIELGFFGLPMAFLIGWGVAMGAGERGIGPALTSITLTFIAWQVVLRLISNAGYPPTLLDATFCIIGCVFAYFPILRLPRRNTYS